MANPFPTPVGTIAASPAQNKVLRNTFIMLGLTLIPTILGALVGMKVNLPMLFSNPIVSMVVFLAVAFGFIFAIQKTADSMLGVGLLLAFTGFMGFWIGPLLRYALGLSNGEHIIAMAAGGTALSFFVMAGIATFSRRSFSSMSGLLTVGLVVFFVAVVANAFLQIPMLSLVISAIGVILFSLFILFDMATILNGGETNYVRATLSLYLDIFNVFVNLLNLLMMLTGQRD